MEDGGPVAEGSTGNVEETLADASTDVVRTEGGSSGEVEEVWDPFANARVVPLEWPIGRNLMGDFNDDGYDDVALYDDEWLEVLVWRPGRERFEQTAREEVRFFGRLHGGFVDGDDVLDIIGFNTAYMGPAGLTQIGVHPDTFEIGPRWDVPGVFVGVADLYGDRRANALVQTSSGIHVYAVDGAGGWESVEVLEAPEYCSNPIGAFAEINGDGDVDVVVAGSCGAVIFTSTDDGSLALQGVYDTGIDEPLGVTLADFDDDAKLDLAVWTHPSLVTSDTTVTVRSGSGDGQFDAVLATVLDDDGNWQRVTPVDVDGDGVAEPFVATVEGTLLDATLDAGFARITDQLELAPPPVDARYVQAANLDGDACEDIVTSTDEQGTIAILVPC